MEINFNCSKCNKELILEKGETVIEIEDDPYSLNKITKSRTKTLAICGSCNTVDLDYFNGLS